MVWFRIAVILFCWCTTGSSALSLPINPYIGENNILESSIASVNSTNLTAADPPAGFVIKYFDWNHILQKPTQMVINAIELMYYLTTFPSDSEIDTVIIMTGYRKFTTEIMLDTSPGPGRMTLAYAVQALFQMGVRMALEKRYFQQWGKMFVKGKQVGILRFQPLGIGSQNNDSVAGVDLVIGGTLTDNCTLETPPFSIDGLDQGNYSAPASDEGVIFDPKDKQLMVEFKFSGFKILGSEVFTAMLDGLAIATEHNEGEVGASINTYSATLATSLYIHHLDSPRYYQRGLTWRVMAKILIMVWEQLIMGDSPGRRGRLPRYEGLDLDIYYENERIGVGELWTVDSPKIGVSVSK